MPDYKRLVSYMYNYERGMKRNNVGYARVEARNGQCKYTLHITAPSLNDKRLKVYIFKRKENSIEGILLGTLQIKNAIGDFKMISDSVHIMNSPYGLEDMGGIVLSLSEEKFFATTWDDKPITRDMVLDLERSKIEKEEDKVKAANVAELLVEIPPAKNKIEQEDEQEQEDEVLKKLINPNISYVGYKKVETEEKELLEDELMDEDDEELEAEELEGEELGTEKFDNEELGEEEAESQELDSEEFQQEEAESQELDSEEFQQEEAESQEPDSEESSIGGLKNNELVKDKSENKLQNEVDTKLGKRVDQNRRVDNKTEAANANAANINQIHRKNDLNKNNNVEEQSESVKAENQTAQNQTGNSKVLFEDHTLAQQIYRDFPRMYPFEDNEIAWCVRLEPKDIGLLPMDSWVLGNNSFLLHGYYSYRHLIFARINDKDGLNYILGVPGIYHNREKFMAKMFGFENFKCAKRKTQRTGEFGYWYIPIIMN